MSRKNDGFIDFQLRLSGPAWQVLHALEGEPSFAPWDEKKGEYKIECETAAFYNGRERGFCLKVNHEARFAKSFLYVCFANNRNSDDVVVYTWQGGNLMNPPGPGDMTDDVWKKSKYFKSVDDAAEHIRGLMGAFLAQEERTSVVEEVMPS